MGWLLSILFLFSESFTMCLYFIFLFFFGFLFFRLMCASLGLLSLLCCCKVGLWHGLYYMCFGFDRDRV